MMSCFVQLFMSGGGTYENGLGHGTREDLIEANQQSNASTDQSDTESKKKATPTVSIDAADDEQPQNDTEPNQSKATRPLAGIRRTKVG